MKKTILGVLMMVLIMPSVSFANCVSDLEAKKLDLMKQLVL